MLRPIAATMFFVLLLWSPAWALDLDVKRFTLANGLEVVAIPDPGSQVVTHMVWYRVGAADEPKGKSGIAHFLEHLMFKGTARHPAGEFSRLVRLNGGEENAFTTQDYTAYFQQIARGQLELVMELEADRMQNLVLTDENVLPELQVVLEERRQRTDNNPSSLLGEQIDAAMYMAHPYGKPVIGWMSEVMQLTRQDALDFYHRFYRPDNAVLVVAGDVSAEEVRQLAETYYGPLRGGAPAEARVRTDEPEPIAARRVVMEDARAASPVWQRSYLAPAAGRAAKNQGRALEMLADILGGGARSRLYRTLVTEKKLAAYAGAWYAGDALDYGSFGIYAAPNPGVDVAQIEAAVDVILRDLLANGVTDEELGTTRNRSTAEAVYVLDQQQALARLFGVALTTGQTVADVLNWDRDIGAVTTAQLRDAAAAVIQPRRSVTGILLPTAGATAGGQTEPAPPGGIVN